MHISLADCRNLALRSQGFGQPRTLGRPATVDDIQRVFDRTKLIQIDSVNALNAEMLKVRLPGSPIEMTSAYSIKPRFTLSGTSRPSENGYLSAGALREIVHSVETHQQR